MLYLGIACVGDVMGNGFAQRWVDGANFRRNFVQVQVQVVGVDEVNSGGLAGIPQVGHHHLHEPNHATGLLEALVFFELADKLTQVRVEGVRIQHTGEQRFGGCGGQAHLHRFAQRFAVGLCHLFDFRLGGYLRKQAFAQDVVQLIAVGVDRRDGHGDAAGLRGDALHGAVEGVFQPRLAHTEVGARQVGQHKADIRHVCHSNKKIGQRGCGHNAQVCIAHWHCHGVFEVRRQFIQEKDQWLTAQQLLPGFRARSAEQGGHVTGKLICLAQLLCNGTPDTAHCIGAAAIEAHHTAWPQGGRGVLVAGEHFVAQGWIACQQAQRNHAVRLTAAHGLREQEH